MLAPALAVAATPAAIVLAEATTGSIDPTQYGIAGVVAFVLGGVIVWLSKRQQADHERAVALLAAELAAERGDRREAQKAVNDWLPLMTRTATAMETVAQYLQTEVRLRAEPDRAGD